MISVMYVAVGGAIGSVLRFWAGKGAVALFGHGFAYGTIGVNVFGSLCMGLLVGWMARHTNVTGYALHLLLATGVLGGFTTFSAFSLDTVTLFQRGELWTAALYVLATVSVSIAALILGLWFMR